MKDKLLILTYIALIGCNSSFEQSSNHSNPSTGNNILNSETSTESTLSDGYKDLDKDGYFSFIGGQNFLKNQSITLNGKSYNISNLSSITYSEKEDLYYGVIDRLDWYDDNKAQIFKFKISVSKKVSVELVEAIELKDQNGHELGFVDIEAIDLDDKLNIFITSESADNNTLGYIDSSLLLKFSPEGILIESADISQNLNQKEIIINPNHIKKPAELVLLEYPSQPESEELPVYAEEIPANSAPVYNEPIYELPAGLLDVPEQEFIKTTGDKLAQFSYNLFIGWWNGKVVYKTQVNALEIERIIKHNQKLIKDSELAFEVEKEETRKAYLAAVNKWAEDWKKYNDWKDKVLDQAHYANELALQNWKIEVELIEEENANRKLEWEAENDAWNDLERIAIGQDGKNLGVESMALDQKHNTVISIVEGSLKQDNKDLTRIIVDRNGHRREYLYPLDNIKSVVSDIHHLEGNKLLVLEKRFDSYLKKVFAKLYLIDLSYEVSLLDNLADNQALTVKKKELLDLNLIDDHLMYTIEQVNEMSGVIQIDNLEGITLGPKLPSGARLLVLVSDANRQLRTNQITQFIILAVDEKVFE